MSGGPGPGHGGSVHVTMSSVVLTSRPTFGRTTTTPKPRILACPPKTRLFQADRASRVSPGLGRSPAPSSDKRTCDITRGVRRQECDCAHEVLRLAHLPLGDERRPLLLQIGVVVEDLAGPGCQCVSKNLLQDLALRREGDAQCGEHVTRADAVDPNASMRPLHRQTGS